MVLISEYHSGCYGKESRLEFWHQIRTLLLWHMPSLTVKIEQTHNSESTLFSFEGGEMRSRKNINNVSL